MRYAKISAVCWKKDFHLSFLLWPYILHLNYLLCTAGGNDNISYSWLILRNTKTRKSHEMWHRFRITRVFIALAKRRIKSRNGLCLMTYNQLFSILPSTLPQPTLISFPTFFFKKMSSRNVFLKFWRLGSLWSGYCDQGLVRTSFLVHLIAMSSHGGRSKEVLWGPFLL